ncbi:uncharacterized protein THITE_2057855 [Thermothielavioides terrestris NRRL 8126]|uniref:Uncharacterized protein n=1 Tax=Thermothielavioides terrestris (strain ATCC 38088 / NRRL 8126) TaxID=578455 RepID=G2RD20_THETT|nr:uncharacterized protein THITE_2057855 [Thermothielavioides terrestris NRRL 8126]AEO70713.1 hypothetical protein THITE_2057855 [Thermothielavioides terrestris NRRL 8126]
MVDPLGLIGVVGVAIQIIQLAAQLGLDWKHAPADASSFMLELQSLKTVLSETNMNGRHSALLSQLDPLHDTDTKAMVSACKCELESLLEDLKKRAQGHSLGWERLKGAFQAEARRVLDWLTPADYGPHHSDIFRRRQPGTGLWLLESDKFQTWVDGEKQMLFCPGVPGAGKTMLASIVIDHLQSRFHDRPGAGIAFVYCNFRRQDEQTAEHLIASLLKQLACRLSSLPGAVKALYDRHAARGLRPSLGALAEALRCVAAMYEEKVFIVVDALDECKATDGTRENLMRMLLSLQSADSLKVNLLTTSRSISDVERQHASVPRLEVRATKGDIQQYVQGHMSELKPFVARRQDLQKEIVTGISDAVDGIFLLAILFFQSFRDKTSPKAIKNSLEKLRKQSITSDDNQKLAVLRAAYDEAMARINGQMPGDRDLALKVLSWITCARWPLRALELRHALAVELGEEELDEENLPETEDMVSVCAGLVTIDHESGIIRLVHYTTQEYFNQTRSQWFPDAESDITKTCATYLSFTTFGSGPCRTDNGFHDRVRFNPLYAYATHNWAYHAHNAQEDCKEVIDFLRMDAQVQAAYQALLCYGLSSRVPGNEGIKWSAAILAPPEAFAGLHLAAYSGLDKALGKLLLFESMDPDRSDGLGRTPLSYAAWQGHTADRKGRTPLMHAAKKGHVTTVKALLTISRVDIDAKELRGRTALSRAAARGHTGVVELLLDTGQVDVNAAGTFKYDDHEEALTPYMVAVKNGHTATAEVLFKHGGRAIEGGTGEMVDCEIPSYSQE